MSFEDFLVAVVDEKLDNLGLRRGQAAFNVLSRMRPDLAEQIHGTDLDPFYREAALDDFYNWVGEKW